MEIRSALRDQGYGPDRPLRMSEAAITKVQRKHKSAMISCLCISLISTSHKNRSDRKPPAGWSNWGVMAKKMSSSQRWTPEEDARLQTLTEAARTVSVVAKELKRTEASVAGRAYRLGLRFGKPKSRGKVMRRLVDLGLEVKGK